MKINITDKIIKNIQMATALGYPLSQEEKKYLDEALQEKAVYDSINSELKEKYGSNATIQEFYKSLIKTLKNHSNDEVTAFRVLTNETKDEYESWLKEKSERENPRPLTLEKLKQMHGKPVWVKDFVMNQIECLQFDKIETAYIHTGDDLRFNQFGTETGIIRWCCKYGKNWLAYDYEPKGGIMMDSKKTKLKRPIFISVPFGDISITINKNTIVEYYTHDNHARIITKNVQFNMAIEDFKKLI